ncbi:MAG: hypothetical protein SGJ09_12685, partial [Phycisphaerae bacterium]|nr:hypothetical protein [Phycisphaerae bacterium]
PPAIQLASGFKYSEDELTPDFPDVATIRLGERLRIYHRGPWTPSTIAFLDDQGNVVTSFRLDLPPRGTVSGTFPSGVAIANVRVTSAAEPFEVTSFDRCIGVNEPELSAERLEAMGVFQSGSSDRASAPSADAHLSRPIGVLSRETSLDPNFGRICLYAGTSSYSGVADEWKGTGPSTDAHWLDGRVRDAIRLSQVKQVK